MTSDIPEVEFDQAGVSNLALRAEWRLENEVYKGAEGAEMLAGWVSAIKASGQGKDYDCIIGVSGGVDSSYVAMKVAELGLRPLAVHLDNGWNSDTAVSNIEKVVRKLGIDLHTHVVDWREIKDLQRSYIKGGLLDLECVSDHAINTILMRMARKEGIKYLIHGGNVSSESILPSSWGYDKRDGHNLVSIHKKFGTVKLKTYPHMSPFELFYHLFVRRMKAFAILNYLDYNKTEAIEVLKEQFDWTPYPRKHGENRFTRFFQEYYLPQKFGIDKRIAHFSSLIVSDEMTRDDAIKAMKEPLYTGNQLEEELEFVAKKLGFSVDELTGWMDQPGRKHQEFKNVAWMFDHNSKLTQLARYLAKGEFSWRRLREVWRVEKSFKTGV